MAVNATPDVAPIGVVVAMESELQHLLASSDDPCASVRDGPWLDRFVSAGDVPLIALCSGIGMVNAAAGTEHLIGRYAPRAILNYGCAGAHRRDILPGDVIIGDGTVHHGAVHILASGEEFFPGKDYEVTGEVVASTELATDPELTRSGHRSGEGMDARAVAARSQPASRDRAARAADARWAGRLGRHLDAVPRAHRQPPRPPWLPLRRHGGRRHRPGLRTPWRALHDGEGHLQQRVPRSHRPRRRHRRPPGRGDRPPGRRSAPADDRADRRELIAVPTSTMHTRGFDKIADACIAGCHA